MHDIIKELLANGPVITDGAWGTQLQMRGLPIGECPDLWNLSQPDRVEEVAFAYVEAGSRIILTNTFGASRIALARHDMSDQAFAINRAGVEISCRAAGNRAKVFASMGPCGKMVAMGDVTEEAVFDAFLEQAKALQDGGADGIVIETMSDLDEARIALLAAKSTGLPVVASMAFDSGKASDRTMMGVTPEQAAKVLSEAGADAVGANCGRGPAGLLPICERMKAVCNVPIWIKPNAGLPEMVEGHTVCIYRTTPDEFAEEALKVVDAGASFIGGCCGTGPVFIRALAERMA